MSTELDTIKILEACISYTTKYSLIHTHQSIHHCYSRVIPLASVQNMLSKEFPVEAYEIIKLYTTVQNFFERTFAELDDTTRERLQWIIKVMDFDEYQSDYRVFPPLKTEFRLDKHDKLQKLFVIYQVGDINDLRDILRDRIYENVLQSAGNIITQEDIRNSGADVDDFKESKVKIQNSVEEKKKATEKNQSYTKQTKVLNKQNEKPKATKQEVIEALDNQKTETNEKNSEKIEPDLIPTYADEHYDLTEELDSLNRLLAISKQSYAARASIIDRINYMLHNIWGLYGLYVTAYGSTMNNLGTDKTNLDLCIVIPHLLHKSDYEKRMLKLLPNSVFNMNTVATYLNQIGMVDIEAVNGASVPICKFTDPFTGLHCNINTNHILGIENTQLIIQYMLLDVRVRPFLFAIKFFAQQRNIMNTRKGTMSSYAYLLMGLHYLMHVQSPPVLPSLHNLTDAACKSPVCRSKSNLEIDHWSVAYHDCVVIENTVDKRLSITGRLDKNSTLWPSTNGKGVDELFIGFLEHFSTKQNLFAKMSITEHPSAIKVPEEWKESKAVIQDPFHLKKNVAYSVTEIGGTVVCKEFERAIRMLKEKSSFRQVIESKSEIERPMDPDTLDYKYGNKDIKQLNANIVFKQKIHC